jgi:phospholipid/cholesterol/gamma-HCH transport system substrate-binding protein
VGVLAAAVLAAGYLIFMYTKEGSTGQGRKYHALFRDALGLYDKTAIRSAGIDIGRILNRAFDPESKKARVTIQLDKDMVVYENALVTKRSASLLGEFYLDVDPGTPVDPMTGRKLRVLPDGAVINSFEPTQMSEIIDQVGSTLPILKEILRDVKEITAGPVKQIAENANALIERNSAVLERLLQRVDNIAAEVEGITASEADDVKVAIRNIRDVTEGLKGLVGTSKGEVSATGEELRGSLQKLQKSIDSLEKSMENVETITSRVKQGEGTVGQLLTDPAIANNVKNITDDAGSFVHSITGLQTMVGLRTEYNWSARTFKNYFSVVLAPRPDKFYLIEIIDDPRGFRETTSTTTQSSRDGLVQETEIKTSQKLRFSFQFGKRIGAFTGRFGIKESTGGIGGDLSFLEDRLVLSADLFDARSNERPRLQGRGSFAVYNRNIFLVAGVDDVLNRQRAVGSGGAFFDLFFGLQLIFRDEDLKSLLFVGGGAVGSATK